MTDESTMTIITIETAGKYDGQEVTIHGWLYNIRESGKLLFPDFSRRHRHHSGRRLPERKARSLRRSQGLTQESSVIVTGKIRAEQRAPGGYEIGVSKIQIVQRVSEAMPFPSSSKSMASIFSSTSAISGFAPRARPPSCASAPKPFAPRAIHGLPGLHAHRRSDLHARGLRRHLYAL